VGLLSVRIDQQVAREIAPYVIIAEMHCFLQEVLEITGFQLNLTDDGTEWLYD
jgi:hypothetical protein